jgi:hypothetical protein
MATYQLFIEDDRYSVATLRLLAAMNDARARAAAEAALLESAHHRGVELYLDDRRLVAMGSLRAQAGGGVGG